MIFHDRKDAGQRLAKQLLAYKGRNPLVIGLPRGGVPVAAEVAGALGAPLDVLIVRKVGAPDNPEYAIGAMAEGGTLWIREGAVREVGVSPDQLQRLEAQQQREIERRMQRYRAGRPMLDVRDRLVLLIDDGLATGATMMAAVRALKLKGASHIVVGVPCASLRSAGLLRQQVEAVVAIVERDDFYAIGQWYLNFAQVSDEEVASILAHGHKTGTQTADPRTVEIQEGKVRLLGDLSQPESCRAWVIFAHGSGSSRKSPRNMHVAHALNALGLGTLLLDLLMPREADDRRSVFDIKVLAARLLMATRWLRENAPGLPIGYFGASTGAAAALAAAADPDNPLFAIVSRGGRPDLADSWLPGVHVPVLLLVGALDEMVLAFNKTAAKHLANAKVIVIPGATHLFEEPGTLDEVIDHAGHWFVSHIGPPQESRRPGLHV